MQGLVVVGLIVEEILNINVTRAGVCKTLCPQLPDSNTV